MAIEINITVAESDFQKMIQTSAPWGKHWMKQKGRFSSAPLFTWKVAYWFDRYLESLICQQYLSSRGFESQTVWDNAQAAYVMLTNYEVEDWEDNE